MAKNECTKRGKTGEVRFIYKTFICLKNITNKIERPEAVARRCSVKKVFLEISQSSQKNTCVRASFSINLQACDFIKKETPTQFHYCEFYKMFKSTFFYRTPPVAASEKLSQNLMRNKKEAGMSDN